MELIKSISDIHDKIKYGTVSGSKSYDAGTWTALFTVEFDQAFSAAPKVFVCNGSGSLNNCPISVDSVIKTKFRILIYNSGSAGTYNYTFYWLAINL